MALAARTAGAPGQRNSANFFDLPESMLRTRRNSKWNVYGPDILPAFVAEMDFAVAEPIQDAMRRAVAAGDYGYPQYKGGKAEPAVVEAFVARMEKRLEWKTDISLVQVVADLVKALSRRSSLSPSRAMA
jgi:cystathionine beta-lyase